MRTATVFIMSGYDKPFFYAERMSVPFTPKAAKPEDNIVFLFLYNFVLDLKASDSANYSCEVSGPNAVRIGRTQYAVIVRSKLLIISAATIYYAVYHYVVHNTSASHVLTIVNAIAFFCLFWRR